MMNEIRSYCKLTSWPSSPFKFDWITAQEKAPLKIGIKS